MAQPRVGAVILGAGFGRRFGSDKRLHPLNQGTVAQTTCKKYRRVFDQVRVVLRPEDRELITQLENLGVHLIFAPDAHLGMGHSLAAGFEGLDWTWAFVGLMDMPYVQVETLRQLYRCAEQAQPGTILTPALTPPAVAEADKLGVKQKVCHPIGWHRQFFAEISACSGDRGAREILGRHLNQQVPVHSSDLGLCLDIDHPDDVRADL